MAKRLPGRQYYANGRIKPVSRDYAAEERRRNLLAWARDHGTRAKQRGKIERGEIAPFQPKRVRSRKTIEAQERRLATKVPVVPRSAKAKDKWDSYDWSALFAKRIQAEYHPELASSLGVSRYTYTKIYMDAFIRGDQRYHDVRYDGGSDALGEWFVTLNGFYTATEYEARYVDRGY